MENTKNTGKKKIAVLGGGISSLTAIYELTEQPGWQEKYDITLYQMGWRLGGKGASGRNKEKHDRIEEHGLHLWFGFYHNAFNLIKRCYKENKRPEGSPLSVCFDSQLKSPANAGNSVAFKGFNTVVLEENISETEWAPWDLELLISGKEPGNVKESPSMWGYVFLTIKYLFKVLFFRGNRRVVNYSFDQQKYIKSFNLWYFLGRIARVVFLCLLWVMLVMLELISNIPVIGKLTMFARFKAFVLKKIERDDIMRRLWIVIELFTTNLKGIYFDRLLTKGFDAVNDVDYKEWLERHGASKLTRDSTLVQAAYGIVFGGRDHYKFEAGTALRGILRMALDAQGHAYYKMQGGMGDVIFAPLYEVLRKRGVKFRFFYKVQKLVLSKDKTHIEKIVFDKQAVLKKEVDPVSVMNGDTEYDPLRMVKGMPCWPNKPLYEQLVQGEQLEQCGVDLESYYINYDAAGWCRPKEIALEYQKDFDIIIQGISIGALPCIAKEILEVDDEEKKQLAATETGKAFLKTHEKWRTMVDKVTTTPTQAFQLWLNMDTESLGWKHNIPLLGSYVQPYDTWADMSFLIDKESWSDGSCRSIGYFCGALTDLNDKLRDHTFTEYNFPVQQLAVAKQNAFIFLQKYSREIWSKGYSDELKHFRWELLAAKNEEKGRRRFEAQYFRANVNPSDLYVLSETNTTRYRLRTDESGFTNMYITGDWIFNGFNCGCIESAVMSGIQTARAISGLPLKVVGEKDRCQKDTVVGRLFYNFFSAVNAVLRRVFPTRF